MRLGLRKIERIWNEGLDLPQVCGPPRRGGHRRVRTQDDVVRMQMLGIRQLHHGERDNHPAEFHIIAPAVGKKP